MIRAVLAVVALSAAAQGLLAAPAQAGSYHMYSCAPPGINLAAQTRGPWTYVATSPSSQIQDQCNRPVGNASFGVSNFNNVMNDGSLAGWRLTPPAPIGIVRVRSFTQTSLVCTAGSCAVTNGAPGNVEGAPGHNDFATGGFTSPVAVPPAPTYTIALECATGGGGCSFRDYQPLFIFGTDTELSESVPPTGAVAGGTLLTPGVKATPASVSYTASDGQSGILRVEALLGDSVAGVDDFSRDLTRPVAEQNGQCSYIGYDACPQQQTRDLQVDPAKAPAGVHVLRLRITDAAGNVAFAPGPVVSVAGGPAVSTPNGAGASRNAKLTARFTSTRRTSRRVSYRTRPTFRGRLLNEAGRPIVGASVAVRTRRREFRARTVQQALVTTTARGTFSYRLPRGPSRDITFQYTAFSDDARPSARVRRRTLVRAQLSASIRPRRPLRGQPVRITGRLRYLRRAGVAVVLQARDRRVWRLIAQGRTRRDGRFRINYRFKRSAVGRSFPLRVRVDSPVYPFAPGTSRRFAVRVR